MCFGLLLQDNCPDSDHWVKGYEYFKTLDVYIVAIVIPFSWG